MADRILMGNIKKLYQSLGKKKNGLSGEGLLAVARMPQPVIEIVREHLGDVHVQVPHPFKARSTLAINKIMIEHFCPSDQLWYDESCVLALLYAGADINQKGLDGETLLHRSASYNHYKVVCLLLRFSADANVQARCGGTPLHYAVGYGNGVEQVIEVLLRAGADVNARNRQGRTPLHVAKQWQQSGMRKYDKAIEYLRSRGGQDPFW